MQLKKINVIVTGYNHEKYIAQCLDSVLQQKGDFKLEVILGDDCSTDNTRNIMQDYQEKYPDIFILLPLTANMGIPKNLKRCLGICSGDYIAFCESDDYWIDTYKLQKQMDLLESHPDYSMCFNAIILYFQDDNRYEVFQDQLSFGKDTVTIEDLLTNNLIGTVTCCMYRTSIIRKLPEGIYDLFLLDWIFNMACSRYGKIGFIRDWGSVYRKHTGGAWSGRAVIDRCRDLIQALDSYNQFFSYEYDEQFRRKKEELTNQYNYAYQKYLSETVEKVNQDVMSVSESGEKVNQEVVSISNKPLSFFKKCGGTSIRIARNPLAAFNLLFTNTLTELNKYQTPANKDIDLTHQNIFKRLIILTKRYGGISIRAVSNPHAACDALRTIAHNTTAEVDNYHRVENKMLALNKQDMRDQAVDILLLDNMFPHPLSPFRLQEFHSYLKYFSNAVVLTTGDAIAVFKETKTIQTLIHEFEYQNPELSGRTQVTTYGIDNYTAKLACIIFQYNTNMFLEAMEKKGIPFIFTLYPGGAFELNQENSDLTLRRILASDQFRKVIVTQKITYDYLIKKHLCTEDKVHFIFGVVTPLAILTKCDNCIKKHYGIEKNTLDICFVAYKYMERGVDKGYDVFIGVAKKLMQLYNNINFYVVGNFNEADVPISGLEGRITFYGLQSAEWFDKFYQDKDIILSPNIPFTLRKGSFDAFPTTSCTEAGLRKVAIFCTDELKLNSHFIDNEEIVIIPHDINKICQIIEVYYNAPDKLRSICEKGAVKFQEVYGYENQILPRIKLLEAEFNKGLK